MKIYENPKNFNYEPVWLHMRRKNEN